ncbi:Schizosaccharomyces specific protein Mug147 [Schizosaccharomyces pombe]|uniref:Meiotically up-regulated gene 147 protein n=1 Tax=Schizosaccharomyces pombe (strain 972 / ATCC 24843) TaxID=284812 RepID=MU147_SCHPO|nr:protein mug147 [Schizosaccharomyces pombe]O60057.1 RecName: Full=Meiotically up-regulated gene 147 protein [Schizosaccharomyces pombe 972h-]CAA18885.1 sequence orphan [Schizosaccharomyces pombe]|eukprot:NP_596711.1 protein mug147 [Schizosaccharomyces pombe]
MLAQNSREVLDKDLESHIPGAYSPAPPSSSLPTQNESNLQQSEKPLKHFENKKFKGEDVFAHSISKPFDGQNDEEKPSLYSHLTNELYETHDSSDYFGTYMEREESGHDEEEADKDASFTGYYNSRNNDEEGSELADSQMLPMTESFADIEDIHHHQHEDEFSSSNKDKGFTYEKPVTELPPKRPPYHYESSSTSISFVNGGPNFRKVKSGLLKPDADAASNLSTTSLVNQEYVMKQVTPNEYSMEYLRESFPQTPMGTEASGYSFDRTPHKSDIQASDRLNALNEKLLQGIQQSHQPYHYTNVKDSQGSHQTKVTIEENMEAPSHQAANRTTLTDSPLGIVEDETTILTDLEPSGPGLQKRASETSMSTNVSLPYYQNGRRVRNILTPYPTVSLASTMTSETEDVSEERI